jgi:hypothetical protein
MIELVLRSVCALGAALISLSVAGQASALTVKNSPYASNTPVRVYVGASPADNNIYLVYCDTYGSVHMEVIGNQSTGLNDDYLVYGSNANDRMMVLQDNNGVKGDSCPAGLTRAINYGGHYLDMYGKAGSDQMYVMPVYGVDTWMWGDANNDLMTSWTDRTYMIGGSGNDVIQAMSSYGGSQEGLYGEDGNDCIQDNSGTFAASDCGAGTDSVNIANGDFSGDVNCEMNAWSCTWTAG